MWEAGPYRNQDRPEVVSRSGLDWPRDRPEDSNTADWVTRSDNAAHILYTSRHVVASLGDGLNTAVVL